MRPARLAKALLLPALMSAGALLARHQIIRQTFDGGGDAVQGVQYSLNGTAGQPDTALAVASQYQLAGGFWASSATQERSDELFADGFE